MRLLLPLLRLLRRADFAVIDFVEVTPDPVIRGRREPLRVEVVTGGAGEAGDARDLVRGELAGPDGPRIELDFVKVDGSPFEESWVAEHVLDPEVPRGEWRVVVRAGESIEQRAFRVVAGEEATETRITEFVLSPDPVEEGAPLSFRGLLEAGRDEDWVRLGGQRVVLTFRADGMFSRRDMAEAETDESGVFSTTVTATESGFWRAEFRAAPRRLARAEAAAVASTRSAEVHSTVQGSGAQTRIAYSVIPMSGKRGRTATHKGTLVVWVAEGPGRWDPLPQKAVRLRFDPAGAAASSAQGTTTTGSRGQFAFKKKVPSTGDWQVRFDSDVPAKRKSAESPVRRVTAT
ncbi:hypothetical protein [Planotetraspora sp. GP83]|uniref:hypothetical protein n=1 Tax=Planotetraspora sp. GP83 TaxID=3156264 RepID=UPI003519693F